MIRNSYVYWLRLVEIMKDKNSTLRVGPEGVDSEGDIITNVQNEAGAGECMYRTKGWIY